MMRSSAPGRVAVGASSVALGLLVLAVSWVAAAPTDASTRVYASSAAPDAGLVPSTGARATATWCGTSSSVDRRPNTVAGHPVHWIYAVPSDGQDRLASFASSMQTDAETIDVWWRGQDTARTPRNDLAPFGCGNQLDISSVRLQQSSGQVAAQETPFEAVFTSLASSGFASRQTKYVVYYDGPVGNDNICGVGGSIGDGFGLAVLSTQACAGVERAQVVAHELVHALGAVAFGAPNECPPPDDGHTCDNVHDLLYPVTDGTPLSGLTLDPGRDDYYGHSGNWLDIQDSPWLLQLDRQAPFALAISGPGGVESDVPGLECSQSCSTTWNSGTQLTLTAAPRGGARFVRWNGACSGVAACSITVGQSAGVTALFAPTTFRLSVRVSGRGTVRGSSAGILCPSRCASPVLSHRSLRLQAAAARGWRLKTWTGACRGKRTVCVVPMTGNTSARAVFVRR